MNNWWQNFIIVWLNILVGVGVFGIIVLIFYFCLCKYIVWTDKKDEQSEIDKMRQALK
jgi:hypothetical protein